MTITTSGADGRVRRRNRAGREGGREGEKEEFATGRVLQGHLASESVTW